MSHKPTLPPPSVPQVLGPQPRSHAAVSCPQAQHSPIAPSAFLSLARHAPPVTKPHPCPALFPPSSPWSASAMQVPQPWAWHPSSPGPTGSLGLAGSPGSTPGLQMPLLPAAGPVHPSTSPRGATSTGSPKISPRVSPCLPAPKPLLFRLLSFKPTISKGQGPTLCPWPNLRFLKPQCQRANPSLDPRGRLHGARAGGGERPGVLCLGCVRPGGGPPLYPRLPSGPRSVKGFEVALL